jgi:acrylyl-CoA reductase (NADPH)
MAPMARREAAWENLAKTLNREQLAAITTEIGLAEAIASAGEILAGRVRGRLVVDVNR